jgi:hypothetical protein
MANRCLYFIFGFLNIEFLLNATSIALYPTLKGQRYIFDFSRIPSEVTVAIFTGCIALIALSWRTCFKLFSVFGSSHQLVKKLEAYKKIYFLLWGTLAFQGMIICQAGSALLLFFSGETFLGIYANLFALLILVVSYLTLQIGMVKYHEILKAQGLDVGIMVD